MEGFETAPIISAQFVQFANSFHDGRAILIATFVRSKALISARARARRDPSLGNNGVRPCGSHPRDPSAHLVGLFLTLTRPSSGSERDDHLRGPRRHR